MWTWVLENTLVSAALAIVVALLCRCLRSRPAVCHFLWLLVLVRLVVPPLHISAWPPDGFRRSAAHASDGLVRWLRPAGEHRPTPQSPSRSEVDLMRLAKLGDKDAVGPFGVTLVRRDEGSRRELSSDGDSAIVPTTPWGDGALAASTQPALSKRERVALRESERPSTPSSLAAPIANERLDEGRSPLQATTAWFDPEWTNDAAWILLAVWIAGSLVMFVRQFAQTSAFAQTARIARRAPEELARAVAGVAAELRIRVPEVRVVRRLGSPVVWSLGRPVLLWPDPRGRVLDDEGTRGIVAHELAHLRRRDHWIAWFEMAAMVVLWWHPLFWIARREMRTHAELACDAWATSLQPDHRRDYAEALLDVVNRMSSKPLATPALGASDVAFRDFERRLRMILRHGVSSRVSPFVGVAAVALAVLVLPSWTGAQAPATAPLVIAECTPACAPCSDAGAENATCEADECLKSATQTECSEKTCSESCVADDRNTADVGAVTEDASPSDDENDEARGFERYNAGDFRAAAKAFQAQARKGHSPANALFNVACCLAQIGDSNGAFEALEGALQAGWNDADKIRSDSDLASLRDDSRFESIVARAKGREAPAKVREKGKKTKGSKAKRAEVTPPAPSSDAGDVTSAADDGSDEARGFERYNAGDFRAAAEAFQAQARKGHLPSRALFNVACCLAQVGDSNGAFEALEGALQAGWNDAEKVRSDPDLASLRDDSRFESIVARADGREAPAKVREKRKKAKGPKAERAEVAPPLAPTEVPDTPTPADTGRETVRAFDSFNAGDFRAAAEAFQAEAENGESPERAYYNVACCRARLGENDAAIEALEHAVDAGWSDAEKMRDDSDLESLQSDPRLARIFEQLDDRRVLAQFGASSWEELRETSKEGVEANPEDGAAWHHLGWAHLRLGDIDDAIRAFERQEEIGFVRKYARYNLACCYAHKDDRDRVVEWLDKAIDAGMNDVNHARRDPDFATLWSDPRFNECLQKMAGGEPSGESKSKSRSASTPPAKSGKAKPKRQDV